MISVPLAAEVRALFHKRSLHLHLPGQLAEDALEEVVLAVLEYDFAQLALAELVDVLEERDLALLEQCEARHVAPHLAARGRQDVDGLEQRHVDPPSSLQPSGSGTLKGPADE
jgi:hypothetical protein